MHANYIEWSILKYVQYARINGDERPIIQLVKEFMSIEGLSEDQTPQASIVNKYNKAVRCFIDYLNWVNKNQEDVLDTIIKHFGHGDLKLTSRLQTINLLQTAIDQLRLFESKEK